jgi:2-hydroxy-6-oxonona-2,4-dienedioate hydrolase
MTTKITLGTFAAAAFVALCVFAAWMFSEFRSDMRAQAERIAMASQVLQTPCGAIEYAESGAANGIPLLVVHGSGGGFDQGLLLGEDYAARGYRVIAPSRFGYLRTPFPSEPSGERQADQFVCLLEALGIADAAVMGVSAGGISALHFAVRHPDRLRALILLVPAVYRPDPAVPLPTWAQSLLNYVVGADFPFWSLARFFPDTARRIVLATPPSEYVAASPSEKTRADTMLDRIMPVSARREGLINDSRLTTGAARVKLETIRAPTLAISARDDGYGTYESARYSAAHIPNAQFMGFDRGGHMVLNHQREIVDAVDAFVRTSSNRAPAQ